MDLLPIVEWLCDIHFSIVLYNDYLWYYLWYNRLKTQCFDVHVSVEFTKNIMHNVLTNYCGEECKRRPYNMEPAKYGSTCTCIYMYMHILS